MLDHLGPRRGCAELGESLSQERRSQRNVLRPADWAIARRHVLDRFLDPDAAAAKLDAAFELESRERQAGAYGQRRSVGLDFVCRDRRFAVGSQTCRGFVSGRPAEDVEAQVVSHDACEELCVHAGSVCLVHRDVVRRRFNRWPRRRPQRIDPGALVEDLCDVASFFEDCHADLVVFDRSCAPAAVRRRAHHARHYAATRIRASASAASRAAIFAEAFRDRRAS